MTNTNITNLTTRVTKALASNNITTMEQLANLSTKELSAIPSIGKVALKEVEDQLEAFNRSKVLVAKIATKRELRVPKKKYKSAVKELAVSTLDKYETLIEEGLTNSHTVYTNHLTKLSNLDVIKELNYTKLSEFIKYPKPETKDTKESWAKYSLVQKVVLATLAVEALKAVLKLSHKEVLTSIIDVFAKSNKDEIVVNQLVGRFINLGLNIRQSMTLIEVLKLSRMVSTKVIETSTGTKETLVKLLVVNVEELQLLNTNSSDRLVHGTKPDTVEGRSLVNKRKYQYEQEITDVAAIGIDKIIGTPMKLILPEDKLVDMVSLQLHGHTHCEFKNSWEKRQLKLATDEYNYIMANDGVFYNDTTTDGVLRLYNKSNFFSVQAGSDMREYIEFANKVIPNDSAIKWIKIAIVDNMVDGKLTQQESLDLFDKYKGEWEGNGDCEREFHILNNPTEPTGYMLELDAQSQSFNLYGLVTGTSNMFLKSGGNPTKREDFREDTASVMNLKMGVDFWSKINLKSVLMNKAYTSGRKTILWGQQKSDVLTLQESSKQIPLMSTCLKNKVNPNQDELWSNFNVAFNATATNVGKTMKILMEVLDSNTEDTLTWTMPDGIVCESAFTDTKSEVTKYLGLEGKTHQITHGSRIMNPAKARNAVPPRMIQSLDAYLFREVASRLDNDFVGVHDGYIPTLNELDTMCQLYREVSMELYEDNTFSKMFYEATGRYVDFQSIGGSDKQEFLDVIGKSKYLLWI